MNTDAAPLHTLFLYTEEQRGNQLVESIVLGILNDISATDKLLVVQDPHSELKFVYLVRSDTHNLDAIGVIDLPAEKFDGQSSAVISGINYRLGTVEQAMKYLRNHTHWIQDKGSVLSVLLHYVASRRTGLSMPRNIKRNRRVSIPPGVPVETLKAIMAAKAAALTS